MGFVFFSGGGQVGLACLNLGTDGHAQPLYSSSYKPNLEWCGMQPTLCIPIFIHVTSRHCGFGKDGQ
jgi:hypothetical protein